MRESTISPIPSGAGRVSDWVYPDPYEVLLSGNNATRFRNRLNGSTVVTVQGGYGGGAANFLLRNAPSVPFFGPALQMRGDGNGQGQLIRPSNGPLAWVNLTRTNNALPTVAGDYAVTNIVARYGFGPLGANLANLDAGLQVTNTGGIFTAQLAAGFAFLRPALNQVQFAIRPVTGGALILTNVTPAGWDETFANEYRILIQSATVNSNATVTAILNGVPKASFTWTPASIGVTMPDCSTVGSLPFVPQLCFGLNGSLFLMANGGFQIISAPTVSNTY